MATVFLIKRWTIIHRHYSAFCEKKIISGNIEMFFSLKVLLIIHFIHNIMDNWTIKCLVTLMEQCKNYRKMPITCIGLDLVDPL